MNERMPARLIGIDVSTDDAKAMAGFYADVLCVELKELVAGEFTLHRGTLDNDTRIMFVPGALRGATGKGNRFQLNFHVGDVRSAFEAAVKAGGTELEPVVIGDGYARAAVRDPDGNSIVLIEPDPAVLE